MITNVATLGRPSNVANDTTTNFVYSDAIGTPESPADNRKGTILRGEGNGVTFCVPGSLDGKRLNLYIGSWAADLTVEVAVNDTLQYTVTTGQPNPSGGAKWELLCLEYRTNSPADEVKVKVYAPKVYAEGGCVNLSAVTLGGDTEQPPVPGAETIDQLRAFYRTTVNAGRLEADYTQASWAVYQQAITDAEKVLNLDAAAQEQISGAYAALQAGIKGLKPSALDPLTAMQALTYTDADGTVLPYRFYVPEDYDPDQAYPVLLFFHGAGERGTDNQSQIIGGSGRDLFKRLLGKERESYQAILIAPQCPQSDQWVDTPWAEGSYQQDRIALSRGMKAALQLLTDVERQYHVDADRRYIMGVSMGGFGTWDAITRNPDLFAAAVPICGSADPSKAERVKNLPIWAFHGDSDSVVPVSGSREMVAALRAAGSSVKYTEYAGYDHNVWDSAFAEPELLSWLFSQRKAADTSELRKLYEENKDRENNQYAEEDWNRFQKALSEAKNLLDAENVSQEEVDALLGELRSAIAGLKSESVLIRYSNRSASLEVNGEAQRLADLIGLYEVPASAADLELVFKPKEGRLFARVQLDGNFLTEDAFAVDSFTVTIPSEEAVQGVKRTYTFTAVEKATLEIVIHAAEDCLDGSEYNHAVPAVKKAFDKALAHAKKVYETKTAAQSEIDSARNNLLETIQFLSFQAGDKEDLRRLVKLAEEVQDGDGFRNDENWDAFLAALDAANAVLADENALVYEVQAAGDRLVESLKNLVRDADKGILEILLQTAEETMERIGQYRPENEETLRAAIEAAAAVMDRENATQAEVDEAADELAAVLESLRRIPNKDALKELLAEAALVDASSYTAASYRAYSNAVNEAARIYNDPEATQEEVDAASEKVKATKAALRTAGGKKSGGSSKPAASGAGTAIVGAATTAQAAASVVSDTTVNFTLKRGSAYCFKMTVMGGNNLTPSFTVGNGSVLKTQFAAKIGNDYYYRVWATGAPGTSTGVYTTLAGQNAVKHCTVTIG